jgi:hypothetical protein
MLQMIRQATGRGWARRIPGKAGMCYKPGMPDQALAVEMGDTEWRVLTGRTNRKQKSSDISGLA